MSPIEFLCCSEVGEVLVIRDNIDWRGGALKEVAPGFESFEDSKEFLVMDVVVAFGFCHRLGAIGDRVPETIRVFLGDHATGSIAGCVNFNTSGERRVPDGENWLRSESGP